MRRRQKSLVDQSLLAKIERAFAGFRRDGGKGSYPPHLRALTISAIDGGHLTAAVAKAARISEQSVGNWVRTRPEREPQELALVPDEVSAAAMRGDGSARVHLGSGVIIEIPLRSLTPDMIAMFVSTGGVSV